MLSASALFASLPSFPPTPPRSLPAQLFAGGLREGEVPLQETRRGRCAESSPAPSSEKLSTIPEFQTWKRKGAGSWQEKEDPRRALCVPKAYFETPDSLRGASFTPGEKAGRYLNAERVAVVHLAVEPQKAKQIVSRRVIGKRKL